MQNDAHMKVRTRFAPSPTGYLHIGGVRTALFSWLYARRHGGVFILRIEDTDRERSTQAAVDAILEGMHWLVLDYDEGPWFQTRRFDRYKEVVGQLLDAGHAYRCYCGKDELERMRNEAMARGDKPKYNGACRTLDSPPSSNASYVVRFRNPDSGEVVIEDQIQGRVTYQNRELDDLIIARADGTPTYNLTVVVDDMDMAITHVIRGDDHLNNTPRQINIFNALDITPPVYAHVPMILGPDGKKLSKRHGTVSVLQYREEGILPEALLNYLVRLGWSHGDQEIFSREEMINLFDITDVNKAAAALNPDKLFWLNQHYLKQGDTGRLAGLLVDAMRKQGIAIEHGPKPEDLFLVQRERFNNLIEMANKSRCFYEEIKNYDQASAENFLKPEAVAPLRRLQQELEGVTDWRDETIHRILTNIAESMGMKLGKIAQPLRVALTGVSVSPSIDKTVRLLGREQTLSRLKRAIEFIEQSRIIP